MTKQTIEQIEAELNEYGELRFGDAKAVIAALRESRAEVAKLREALVQIAHDTSDNGDFYLQHTAQEALAQKDGGNESN
jgi:hypothetical protein